MKILHLIYTEAVAGAEKYLLALLPGLKNFNIEAELICVSAPAAAPALTGYVNMMKNQGVKTTLLIGTKKNFLDVAKSINKYLKKENIYIIHSHLSNADLLAVLVKIIYNKKIFIISSKHGYDEKYLIKYSPQNSPHLIDRNLYYYYTKFLLKHININLATSKAIADLYFNIKLSTHHFHFIHHGINKIIPGNNASNFIPNQLVIIGRLEKVKGHAFLLNAMPEIIQKIPAAKLLIIGDGNEKNKLEKQIEKLEIKNQVIFMGYKNNPETFIQQSHIVVQPSLFEAFGLVFIEAFALKVPVIAFNAPAANEIITDNETGILTPLFNSHMLAQNIITLLQNSAERMRITENAYQKYLNYYSAERMIKETADWYNSIKIFP